MKGLRNKLKDQCGASILLALLFFLLCSMVGASVLMAAASNAGKVRSSREEQQKYLLLSSALRLVCGELTSAEYYGRYTYQTWTEEKPAVDEEGRPIRDDAGKLVTETHAYHEYKQAAGVFQCGLSNVLPLTNELDLFFASKFPPSYDDGTKHYIYMPMSGSPTSGEHELTLSVNASEVEGLDGPEDTVTVKVRLDENLRIWITAALGVEEDGYIYTIRAQLTGQDNLGLSGTADENQAGPVTWTLEWIAKKEAGDGT